MAWRIEFEKQAEKELAKLDPAVAKRILDFLESRVIMRDDPRSTGSALQGARLGNLWRYRVGDYRIICDLKDDVCVVLVVRVAKREIVYR